VEIERDKVADLLPFKVYDTKELASLYMEGLCTGRGDFKGFQGLAHRILVSSGMGCSLTMAKNPRLDSSRKNVKFILVKKAIIG
jgi:hypothetical protein